MAEILPPGAGALRVVLGDQVSPGVAALADLDPARDVVLMAEVEAECTYVPHHPKKIVLGLSAMRHFARALAARSVRVDYVRLDDPANTQSLRGEVLRAVSRHKPMRIVATAPGEWRVMQDMRGWQEYATRNALDARRKLPWLYWSGETRMECMRQVIGATKQHAHAHHIQHLMVTGNFALLAGIDPDEVDRWYMVVYADAYEWVEMPNTRGMALHADGGAVGSKPYAASGAYINRMSDYCGACAYDVKDAAGARACPFNSLYWDFIARHADRFAGNPRIAMPVRSLERMDAAKRSAIRARAARFLAAMDEGEAV